MTQQDVLGKHLLFFLLRLLVVFFGVAVFGYFLLAFYVGSKAEKDTKIKSDAIVVLGARSSIGGKYNPCLVARVDHAVALYKAHLAPRLLLTGGDDREDGVNEAEAMRTLALAQGIPAEAILLEKQATSTYENFQFSKKILGEKRLHSVIIVTEPFHVARASLVAEKAGLDITVSPATTSPCWQPAKYASRYFLKEPIALLVYKIENKL